MIRILIIITFKKLSKMATAISTNKLLMIIIAVILPPLAVALDSGLSKQFWISLVLTLLFYLPGLIYALYVIL